MGLALGEFNAIVRHLEKLYGNKEVSAPTEAEFDEAVAALERKGLK